MFRFFLKKAKMVSPSKNSIIFGICFFAVQLSVTEPMLSVLCMFTSVEAKTIAERTKMCAYGCVCVGK